jgi:hypothetical protein
MAIVFMMNEEIARGMVCFFHQKKHSYLIFTDEMDLKKYSFVRFFQIVDLANTEKQSLIIAAHETK